MNPIKVTSLLLGLSNIAFGTLKFVNPFKSWYATQIATSGLPALAYASGIVAEVMTGLMYLLPFLIAFSSQLRWRIWTLANISLVLVMAVATVVHLHPNVPAEVLPLKIKPPLIPLLFVTLAIVNQRQLSRKPRVRMTSNNA